MFTPILLLALAADPSADVPQPRVLRDDLALDLFAREPDIVTPVAIDVDSRGRVWAIESNTHFPKPDYTRHPSDRILVISDEDGDGKADRFHVFTDGLQQSMALKLRGDRTLFLATRRDVMVFEDSDGDGRPDRRESLARLETEEQYPHNGLSGFAFDGGGWLYFSIGENMGVKYRLTAKDGSFVDGGPEGGSIFRMRPEGARLERWATGFWNTFHMAFDSRGCLFAVDNDPDSRPPCRLLHIVRGGDYGYRRWLGRKGLHPFTAWNGELPGTLPMVSGTGEAPSGVLEYGGASLPEDLAGKLLVTSWGDHRIEVHAPEARGGSWRSSPVPIVAGGEMFRPVGIAAAPDGSVYFSDWVDQDYHVHMKGRIWRIRAKSPRAAGPASGGHAAGAGSRSPADVLAEKLLDGPVPSVEGMLDLFVADPDPFTQGIAIAALARSPCAKLLEKRGDMRQRARLAILLGLRRTGDPAGRAAVAAFLRDQDLDVRRAAIQWVGEERLADEREHLEEAFRSGPITRDVFDAYIAAVGLLSGQAPDERDLLGRDEFLLRIARDRSRSGDGRAIALRAVSPGHTGLSASVLGSFLAEPDPALRLEAVRSLRESPLAEAPRLLEGIALDDKAPARLRREAVSGLSRFLPGTRGIIEKLSGVDAVRSEAQRALRFAVAAAPARAPLDAAARESLLTGGDASEGEILFFHPRGPRCSSCHAAGGRGGVAGPDLSAASSTPRAKLLESILEPSREVAPQFATWVLVTRDGVRSGTVLGEDADGAIRLAGADGEISTIRRETVVSREMASTSLMPADLVNLLTVDELRDLLAFLEKK